MFKYACEFTVRGRGQLPVDMMRYDRATPLTQEDAAKFQQFGEITGENNIIRMIRFTEGSGRNHADHPTVARWNSFGWQVYDVSFRKLS